MYLRLDHIYDFILSKTENKNYTLSVHFLFKKISRSDGSYISDNGSRQYKLRWGKKTFFITLSSNEIAFFEKMLQIFSFQYLWFLIFRKKRSLGFKEPASEPSKKTNTVFEILFFQIFLEV